MRINYFFISFFIFVKADYNVLFVIIDDLRAEIGPYRNNTVRFTPNIDSFAEEATTFKHAYANVALCGPSRASLFTGRTPRSLDYFQHNLGDVFDDRVIDRSPIATLPKLFSMMGYSTVGAGKVFHRDVNLNEFDNSIESSSIQCECDDEICPKMICEAKEDELTDTAVIDYSLLQLEELNKKNEKFFMSIGIRKPHLPYRVPERAIKKIKELYGDQLENMPIPNPKERENINSLGNYYCDAIDQYLSALESPTFSSKARKSKQPTFKSENDFNWNTTLSKISNKVSVSTQLGSPPIRDDLLKQLKLGYFAAVNWADELFGRIDKKLKELGRYEDTIVFLFSDNGFNLGEQGNFCKNNNFEMSTKVPLLVRHPKGISSVSSNMVTLVDLYPSVLEMAFESRNDHPVLTNARRHLHGKSFKDVILNSVVEDEDQLAFSGIFRCWDKRAGMLLSCDKKKDVNVVGYSVRSRDFRYTEWREFDDYSFETEVLERELFDHSQDLDQYPDKVETSNLIQFLTSPEALPQDIKYSKEYLNLVVSVLSNHLEAHFSCESLNCVEITETFSPTNSPTISPTIKPSEFPSNSPTVAPTALLTTQEPTVLRENSTSSSITPSSEPFGINQSGTPGLLIFATIVVILLACLAILVVVGVYMKKKREDAEFVQKSTFKKISHN